MWISSEQVNVHRDLLGCFWESFYLPVEGKVWFVPLFHPCLPSLTLAVESSTSVAILGPGDNKYCGGQGNRRDIDLDIVQPLNQPTKPTASRLLVWENEQVPVCLNHYSWVCVFLIICCQKHLRLILKSVKYSFSAQKLPHSDTKNSHLTAINNEK